MLRFQQPKYLIPVNGQWRRLSNRWLHELEASNPTQYLDWDFYISEYQKNPLAFMLPHGHKRRGKFTNDGQAFLSDRKHDLIMLRAPTKTGKTYHTAAKVGLHAGPCDPTWNIFTQHKVEFTEWLGPSEGIISSFSWDNVSILWKTICKVFPRAWLGPYSPNWGMFPGETGKPRAMAFGDGKPKSVKLECDMTLTMLCDTQSIIHWESRMADWGQIDEQLSEEKTDILVSRFQTSQYPYNPIFCGWTPFVIPERPDTGASAWMFTKRQGNRIKGMTFAEYSIGMDDVPDEIVTAEKKKKMHRMFVEIPEATHDDKKIRSGRARYYAEPEVGGGLIISAWNPEIHMIEPFDWRKYKPTLYRMIDHGENPCAALVIAVMPWGDAVCIKEYYEYGNSIAVNCKRIVEDMCGNRRVRSSHYEFEGQTWPVFEEVFGGPGKGMAFYSSEMDNRSFGSTLKESGRLIGAAYNDYGCDVAPSSGGHGHNATSTGLVDLLCQWFELDRERPHINSHLGRKVPDRAKEFGAPRIYLSNDLVNGRGEIEGWVRNPKTEKPVDKDDHWISCAKFFTARERPYIEDFEGGLVSRDDDEPTMAAGSDITGY